MTGSEMNDDIRRRAAQHSRDAYNRVKALYIGLTKAAATRQLGGALKAARNELDEITFILKKQRQRGGVALAGRRSMGGTH